MRLVFKGKRRVVLKRNNCKRKRQGEEVAQAGGIMCYMLPGSKITKYEPTQLDQGHPSFKVFSPRPLFPLCSLSKTILFFLDSD